ncbi:MAG TPA: inositol-3-phosphate synthase [Planctomycetota bacterium]|nr:inositol-3-phosphate synthase [Planctomycetota bacterium]
MKTEKLGVWIFGARGAVSTCAITGAIAIAKDAATYTGMVTALDDFEGCHLTPVENFVFGGHDIRQETLLQSAEHLRAHDVISHPIVAIVKDDLVKVDQNIRPGTIFNCGNTISRQATMKTLDSFMTPLQQVRRIQDDIKEFIARNGLKKCVAIYLASTEPYPENPPAAYQDLAQFETELARGAQGFTAGVLYAYAAIDLGLPYVNFTPSPGNNIPALRELALLRKVPHGGQDAKTGETLMKTVIAPLFVARNMRVMSWEGYNMLGNRDGAVLDDPKNNESKLRNKDAQVKNLLTNSPDVHTRVRIDYVPSLDDWKTAWDFIHFRGFLDTKMMFQFIWQGCDSMLAAPLILDLIRLLELAQRRKETGVMKHLACFFKTPLDVSDHNFFHQMNLLQDYARACQTKSRQKSAAV